MAAGDSRGAISHGWPSLGENMERGRPPWDFASPAMKKADASFFCLNEHHRIHFASVVLFVHSFIHSFIFREAMAGKPKLHYFNGRGRMEPIRWLLAAAGVEVSEFCHSELDQKLNQSTFSHKLGDIHSRWSVKGFA